MQDVFKVVVEEDLDPCAKNISVPTLLIWGENDLSTPISQAKVLQSLIKNSKLHIIPNTDHFSFIEKSQEVVELIEGFL